MEVGKPLKIKLVSGTPAEVELAVNLLLDSYAAMTWAFGFTESGAWATCLMVHHSEVRKAQIAQGFAVNGPRQ